MIVNSLATGTEVIFQPAHALLAAQAAAQWRAEARPRPWQETVVAIAQHDNGWVEWEEAPTLTEAGQPRNFTETSLEESMAQWRRGVARGQHQSRWVGLLISHHATHLLGPRRGEGEGMAAFLDEQALGQARVEQALGVSPDEVARAYALLRWCDWLSLLLCWRRLPDDGSPISLGVACDDEPYAMRRRDEEVVTVEPWPFGAERFELSVEARHLPWHYFDDGAALRQALDHAPIVTRRWQVVR